MRGNEEVPFQRYGIGEMRFRGWNGQNALGWGPDGAGVEEDLVALCVDAVSKLCTRWSWGVAAIYQVSL
jgi:hypothetical protein